MKPPPFDYVAPTSIDEAVAALAHGGAEAKLLAGGQSLVPLLNFRLARPALLVDLNRVAELAYVTARDGGLAILPPRELCVRECSEFVGGPIQTLGMVLSYHQVIVTKPKDNNHEDYGEL